MTATNAEIESAGYVLPISSDLVTAGDEAINKNAKAAYSDVRAAEKRAKDYAQPKPGVIPTGHDFATMSLPLGRWSISSQERLDLLLNAPSWMTAGDVVDSVPGIGFEVAYSYRGGSEPVLYYRGKTSAGGAWSAWTTVPKPAPANAERYTAGYGALGHDVRQGFALRRLGGTIGTAGRAAFALRFDDDPAAFRDKVLPILRELQLPGYIASALRYYTESAVPYPTVEGWAVSDGVSIANHTDTHADSTGDANIWANTVAAADYLEQQMPRVLVDVWTMPSVGGTGFDGYNDGRYIESFHETTAGHVIASRHAVVNGYSGGRLQPLVGHPTFGQTHLTFEALTVAEFKSHADEAVAAGMGLTLMLHPSQLDAPGKLTSADFRACLEYLAQLREDGRALTLSPLALGFADAGHAHRPNLLPAGAFPDGATSGTSYVTFPISPFLSQRGAVLELVAHVKGIAGDVFRTDLYHEQTGTKTYVNHTLTDSDWHEVRNLYTLPATAAYDSTLYVSVGRVSGGTVTMRNVRLQTT